MSSRGCPSGPDDTPTVLIGFMAAGKTTVGKRLAALLGREFIDLDHLVALREGRPTDAIIREQGERAFRRAETRALAQALTTRNTVVAAGGGAVLAPENRRLLARARARVVWLKVSAEEAWRRAGSGRAPARPLMPSGPPGAAELLARREAAYAAAATEVIDTDALDPEAVARALAGDAARTPPGDGRTVTVGGGPPGHGPVLVGSGILESFADHPAFPRDVTGPVFVVGDPLALALYGERVRRSLERALGGPLLTYALPSGERAKRAACLIRLWEAMASGGLERRGLVVSVGGGATTDVAGLAASTFKRGIRVVHIPTTLLAQVDAAVGGKTAVDLPQGKNLAGSFHFPSLVAADVAVCRTLGPALAAEGRVELAKTLLVAGLPVGRLREALAESRRGDGREGPAPSDLVARAVRAKLKVVGEDPTDLGPRQALNLGHTFGHALEAAFGYGPLRHGLAVAVGLLAAVRLSEAVGRLAGGPASEVYGLALELVREFPPESRRVLRRVRLERAMEHLRRDKKVSGARVTFVLLDGSGDRGDAEGEGDKVGVALSSDVALSEAERALEEALADACACEGA